MGVKVKKYLAHVHKVHRKFPEEIEALKAPRNSSWTFTCKPCDNTFINSHVLSIHKKYAHKDQIKACTLCKIEFDTGKKRSDHINSIHQKYPDEMEAIETFKENDIKLDFTCKFCGDDFFNLHILNNHVGRKHKAEKYSQDWVCEYCKHTIQPGRYRSTKIKNHLSKVHSLSQENTLSSQIVQPEENESVRNFNLMMQKMREGGV